jgi:hypothetical protein
VAQRGRQRTTVGEVQPAAPRSHSIQTKRRRFADLWANRQDYAALQIPEQRFPCLPNPNPRI